MSINCLEIIKRRKERWNQHHDIDADYEYVEAVVAHILENPGIVVEIKAHPEYLIEMCFVIVDKDTNTVPFFLNDVQMSFLADVNQAKEDYRAGKRLHLKFLILKGRQQGFTSFITAYQLACSITQKNFSGMTLADSGDNTNTIFEDKAKYSYNQLPDGLKPSEKYNNRREFHFETINSRWRVNTAGNKEVGRSKTINFFHGSEAAFWDSIADIMKGLGQALTKDSVQILETTANGLNEYHELWDGAENGKNNWDPKFYAWWRTPEYRLPFENDIKDAEFKRNVLHEADDFFKKLKHLKDVEGLAWDQLYWYYGKHKDLQESLPQEYPCYPEEAFLATGTPVFNNRIVLMRKKQLEKLYEVEKPIRGTFVWDMKGEQIYDNSIKFVEDEKGFLTIYEQPGLKVPYVIGGDIAEGGTDSSSGQVLNNITGNQAAHWHGHIDTDLFAKYMYCLGKYYNFALIAIEMNFDLHPVKELRRLGYYKQYRRETVDSNTKQRQQKDGFRTDRITRPLIISELVAIVREHIDLINDITTLNEMMTFVRNEEGRPEAMEGKHDDTVMSLAIAHKARDQQLMGLDGQSPWSATPDERKRERGFDDDEDEAEKAETFW